MKQLLLAIFCVISLAVSLSATPTTVIVRARAKDAKFIGTGMGGAYVVIRNVLTGEVLTKGITTGNSGNTQLLLQSPIKRHQSLTDQETAKFEASLDITEPVFVEVAVTAPVTRKNASVKGSVQLWLIPGKHIEGDGIIIELPGLIVDMLQPTTHEFIPVGSLKNNGYTFKTSVTMLCGCAITKGGIWDADGIEVGAIIRKDGKELMQVKMALTDKANIFQGIIPSPSKGLYQITVYAFERATGNTGVDQTNFVIQ
ncbi:MAG: hypothetical protein EOO04_07350 [Chitinophagaceae bacterium]|nr:MAG: hypothetical protein EOO04_07350 [Chitinophagaceae bacterium]